MLDEAIKQESPAFEYPLVSRIDPVRMKRLKDQEYRTMYWLIVPICLVAACAKRLMRFAGLGHDAFHSTHVPQRRGLFEDASHMAHTVIPFAFWR